MADWVVVTGASRGIGRALSLGFARRGHGLVLCARSRPELEQLAREAAVDCRIVVADLEEPAGRDALLAACEGLPLRGVVNNAGFGTAGPFEAQDRAKERAMIRLNCEAVVDLAHAFLPRLRPGSFLLNVASTAAFQPVPLFATYAATKAFVLSWSEALGAELAPRGIHVLALCPGPTATGFQAAADVEVVKGAREAREVAEFALRALDARKTVAIHGAKNAAQALGVRFAPRWMVLRIARRTMLPWLTRRRVNASA